MRTFSFALTLSAALFMAGCATKPVDGTASPATASSPAPAAVDTSPRVSTPVAIPAASARKVVMTMTGTKQVVEAKDWADFKREWRDTFADHAKTAGIAFSFVEGDVAPAAEDGTVVRVTVADYRMVGIGMRLMFGIMTGNAYIDAQVKYSSLRDGAVFGEQQFNTSSSAGSGIFAKVTPQQVNTIGTEVFRDLKAAK
jgi:ABC-type uncharacterized transport system auxiliary subunit